MKLMTTSATEPDFTGPYKSELAELASLIEWLSTEHTMAFVKAGDNKVVAYGGDGYILVLDESQWNGLIEFITPKGAVSIKPGEDGRITVTGTNLDEKAIKQLLGDGTKGLRDYYENRYWRTPKTA
jgi:hypothetical protein